MLVLAVDIPDRSMVESAAKEEEASFGRLHILINDGGYHEKAVPIADSNPDEWRN